HGARRQAAALFATLRGPAGDRPRLLQRSRRGRRGVGGAAARRVGACGVRKRAPGTSDSEPRALCAIRSSTMTERAKAVFLDRDGVINQTVLRRGAQRAPQDLGEWAWIEGVHETL